MGEAPQKFALLAFRVCFRKFRAKNDWLCSVNVLGKFNKLLQP